MDATASSTYASGSMSPSGRMRSTSAAVRTGLWMTGPSPLANSRSSPRGSRMRRISAKRMAASTPRRSAAVTVTSVARSGRLHRSEKTHLVADGPVFGHVASCLAHQPYRRKLNRLTAARLEKGR